MELNNFLIDHIYNKRVKLCSGNERDRCGSKKTSELVGLVRGEGRRGLLEVGEGVLVLLDVAALDVVAQHPLVTVELSKKIK